MYHHHSQQQGPPQPFSNRPRPSHHQQPPPTQQQQSRPATDMLSQVLGFQFPPPTQLPDELESALAIRGSRDMDHRLLDHMNQPNQHQNQGSGPAMGQRLSEHGGYSSNPVTLTSDNQQGHQQGVDWSSYQQPTKLFASPPPSASHQPQRHQGLQQQPQNSHSGTGMSSWNATDLPSPQTQPSHSSGNSGGGMDVLGLYTPESAGSILASFGLSNEDLEVLSHYPDDQLTPDTLPFILRDIQINKSNNQNNAASSSSASYSQSVSRGGIHDIPPPPSRSPEVPSLLSVTQTAGKVIDYGHASRAKDKSSGRETFKREPLSSERTVKMYPSPSSSSASKHKVEMPERRQVRLEPTESNKHGDLDYRRPSSDIHKTKRSPNREFPPSSKSRRPDKDYRRDGPKLRPSSETRSESSSRRSLSSSSVSKPQHNSTKKLPTPTMISDFSAEPPKVYPHTCSLCHIQCDQAKDWIDHVNTVEHTAACRDLRNKYPDWKPNLSRRESSLAQDGRQAPWHPKVRSPSRSVSRSLSWSPTPSPPPGKHRVGHPQRQYRRPYLPHHHPRHQHHTGVSTGSSSRGGLKRSHDLAKRPVGTGHHSSSLASKMGQRSKSGSAKMGFKPGTKMTKPTSAKAAASKAFDTSAKPPPAKKKKKGATSTYQSSIAAARLVYLTGIPADASEQEVTDLLGSFGKINNVVLMPGSKGEKGEGQKASVCMVRAEDAQTLAHCTSLSIRDQQITASLAKKTETEKSFSDVKGKPVPTKVKCAAGEDPGSETDQKTSDEKGVILMSGLPESGWSESDIIKLVQPFGTPSDIIMAPEIGKVLVSLPDVETAEEMVKVHTFIPVKIKDSELKMINIKQLISLSTPVALYNLLNGSLGPLETKAPVGWSSLLVISNVPDTPTGPSEVQKLVGRFGTIRKTLILNHNTIVCEMATAGMALAVYKRFQKFPCIIQNNPLSFSRKPDPKASTQTKVIAAYLDSAKDSPANGKDSQTAPAAGKEDSEHQGNGEYASEGKEKGSDGKDDGKMEGVEENGAEGKVEGEKPSKNEDCEVKKDEEAAGELSDSAAAPDSKPEADVKAATTETTPVTADDKKPGEKEPVNTSQAENTKTPSNQKETNTSSTDGGEATKPELPKVTQEMVDALLEECRTRTTGHPNQTTVPPGGEQGEAKAEAAGGEGEEGREVGKEEKDLVKNSKEEEKKKKQDRERKEREAKKQEAKEREKRVWERRAREWEERTRREEERERRERERREKERERREKERERRETERRERMDKRRTHREGSSGSRSSGRSEATKRSAGKDGHDRTTVAEKAKKEVEEEEADFDDFPFDMGDFMTVDEVGDVTDFPHSPSPPSVPVETTAEEEPHSPSLPPSVPVETTAEEEPHSPSPSVPVETTAEEAPHSPSPPSVPVETTAEEEPQSPSLPPSVPMETKAEEAPHSPCLPSVPKETKAEEAPHSPSLPSVPMETTAEEAPQSPPLPPSVPMETTAEEAPQSPSLPPSVPMEATAEEAPQSPSLPPSVTTEMTEEEAVKNTPASVQQDPPEAIPTATTDLESASIPEKTETHDSEPQSVTAPTAALENRASSDSTSGPVLTPEAAPSPNPQASSQTARPASQPEPEATPETVTTTTPTVDSTVESLPASDPATTASLPEAAPVLSVDADAACTETPAAGGVKGDEKVEEESPANSSPAEGEETVAVVSEKPEEEKRIQDEEDEEKRAPAVGTAKRQRSADEKSEEECVKKKPKTQAPLTEDSLPPFDPNNPVGMEFLVPKTGFFCKVCNRFFSGTQEAEIAHCKSLKHYESLQKHLQTRKTANATVKPKSS